MPDDECCNVFSHPDAEEWQGPRRAQLYFPMTPYFLPTFSKASKARSR